MTRIMSKRGFCGSLALALALCLSAAPDALADAIDGNWCFKDGRSMSIRGARIRLPGGAEIAGTYRRHSYAYTVPDGQPDAGSVVSMILVDDKTIHLTPGGSSSVPLKSAVQIWKRCEFTA